MDDIPRNLPDRPVRFMDQFRVLIRSKQLAYKTEKTYCTWVVDFIRYHQMQHPTFLGGTEVDDYLSYLAVKRNLAVNSQKTALNALVFMFKQFLHIDVGVFYPLSQAPGLGHYQPFLVMTKPKPSSIGCRGNIS